MNFIKWIFSLIITIFLIAAAFKMKGLFINSILFVILTVFVIDMLFIRNRYL